MEKEPTNKELGDRIDRGFEAAKKDRASIKSSVDAAHDSIVEIGQDIKEMKGDIRQIRDLILANHERRISDLEGQRVS